MSAAYLQSQTVGGAGGLNVVGHVEASQSLGGGIHGHKGQTPTHLGTSSSFVRHQPLGNAGPMINGHGIVNSRTQAQAQKRGPSAEAHCGGESLSAKNQFLPPGGASATIRSQSFNPERTGAGVSFQ